MKILLLCFATGVNSLYLRDIPNSIWPQPVSRVVSNVPGRVLGDLVWPPVVANCSVISDSGRISGSVANWTECAHETCHCDGFFRILIPSVASSKFSVFSSPLVVSAELDCSFNSLRNYLWRDFEASRAQFPGQCEYRTFSPIQLFTSKSDNLLEGFCMQPPTNAFSPGPVLVSDCLSNGWIYHIASGQVRNDGNCLTAVPSSSNSSWKSWNVLLMKCLNVADPQSRQAWDLPENVVDFQGIFPEYNLHEVVDLPPQTSSFPTKGLKMGKSGRIQLRDSKDIGNRCLEKTSEITFKATGLSVELSVCSNIENMSSGYTVWSVYKIANIPTNAANGSWRECVDGGCSACGNDCELRFTSRGMSTQPVSFTKLENDSVCDLSFLRKMSLPSFSLENKDNRCFCKPHAEIGKVLGNLKQYINETSEEGFSHSPAQIILSANSDDLPKK